MHVQDLGRDQATVQTRRFSVAR